MLHDFVQYMFVNSLVNVPAVKQLLYCLFRMALRKLLDTRPTSPYFKAPSLKILIIAVKEAPRVISWEFANNSATPSLSKLNLTAAISDGDSVTKVKLFEEFASKIKEGSSYIMRGYTLRGGCPPYYIMVTRETVFFKSSPVAAAESLRREALLLLDPPSTETRLAEVAAAGGLITVKGLVTDVSL